MPFNVTAQNNALKSGTGGGIAGIITHVGINTLTTAPPSDTTPGSTATAAATEATGGSPAYARQAVTWGTPSTGTVSNSGALTFDVAAGTYGFFTLWSASSGNTGTQFQGYLCFTGGSPVKGFGEVSSTDVTNDTITSSGHGLANGNRVILFNVVGESIPTGITEGAAYFVVGAATDTFQISTTSGGAAVNLTGQGEVYFERVVPEVFAAQGQITAAIGALVLDASAI